MDPVVHRPGPVPDSPTRDDGRDDETAELRELERGSVAFVVRPRVEGARGVQRFLFLLEPEDGRPARRVVVGKKRLPRPHGREREWAYVDRIAEGRRELLADLGATTYTTTTRGVRHQPGASVVAEGHYRVLAHGTHTHLAYVLEAESEEAHEEEDAASERRALLEALGVTARGSFVVAVFNPLAAWSRQAVMRYGGNPDEATPFAEPSIFPDELQATFGDKRFAPLVPAFLDFVGAELVLLGAQDHLPEEASEPAPASSAR